jgi:hypothetical protein
MIKKVVSSHAYEIDLLKRWKIHLVIYILMLEPAPSGLDPFERPRLEQPGEVVLGLDEWLVERVLDYRYNRRLKKREYLIKWEGYGVEHNQWVPVVEMSKITIRNYKMSKGMPITLEDFSSDDEPLDDAEDSSGSDGL